MNDNVIRKILRNSAWLLANEVAVRMIAVISSVYLARRLGAGGFGLFSLAIAVGMYVSLIADMGSGAGYGSREIAQRHGSASDVSTILMSMRMSLAAALAVLISLYAWGVVSDSMKQWALFGSALIVLANTLSPDWIFRGLERMELIILMTAVSSTGFLVTIFFSVRSESDTTFAIIARSVTLVAGNLLGIAYLWKRLNIALVPKIDGAAWKHHFSQSIHFAANGVLANAGPFIPVIALGWLSTPEETGYFSAAQRIVTVGLSAAAVIPAASYPTMSKLFLSDADAFRKMHDKIIRWSLMLGIPTSLIVTLGARQITGLLFGGKFASSVAMLQIFIWYLPVILVRINYGRSLMCAGHQRFNVLANGIGFATSVLLLLVCIPLWKGRGACIAVVSGEMMSLLLMRFYYTRLLCGNAV